MEEAKNQLLNLGYSEKLIQKIVARKSHRKILATLLDVHSVLIQTKKI